MVCSVGSGGWCEVRETRYTYMYVSVLGLVDQQNRPHATPLERSIFYCYKSDMTCFASLCTKPSKCMLLTSTTRQNATLKLYMDKYVSSIKA